MIPRAKVMRTFHGEVHYQLDEYAPCLKALGIGAGQDWENFAGGRPVAESTKTNCFAIDLYNGETIYFKRYTYTAKKKLYFWMMPSKPMTEVFGFQELKDMDIPTLDVLAYGERRYLGGLRAAYVVTRGIDNTVPLDEFVSVNCEQFSVTKRHEVYHALCSQLLEQVKTAHDLNFFHQDLKWRNILVQENEGEYKLYWIDCPRAHYAWLMIERSRIIDLSGLARSAILYLSIYDIFRFTRKYLGESSASPHRARKLIDQVWRHLSKRLPRDYKGLKRVK
jgi:hypothetical protein